MIFYAYVIYICVSCEIRPLKLSAVGKFRNFFHENAAHPIYWGISAKAKVVFLSPKKSNKHSRRKFFFVYP